MTLVASPKILLQKVRDQSLIFRSEYVSELYNPFTIDVTGQQQLNESRLLITRARAWEFCSLKQHCDFCELQLASSVLPGHCYGSPLTSVTYG